MIYLSLVSGEIYRS
ncbi:hypothetical protein F383_35409 [Gossypium arboreum]|uniref:Uncharacterized protein n=1 Tax=Gossypium arboreum TaxID=29729 RepID=A0A0B0PVQ2_GOSAR|nr:hypothetical protein F383_35409 [Gossypium arboreum]